MYFAALAWCFGIVVAMPLFNAGLLASVSLFSLSVLIGLIAWHGRQVLWFRGAALLALTLLAILYAQGELQQRLAERVLVEKTISATVRVVGLSDDVEPHWRQAVEPIDTSVSSARRWLLSLPYQPHAQQQSAPVMQAGELWQVTVTLKPIRGQVAEGAFDLERWLVLERGITAQAELTSAQRVRIQPMPSWHERIDRLRLALRQHFQHMNSESRGVALGLLTGDRALMTDEDRVRYQDAGISHLLAISGPHVLLMAALFTALLTKFLDIFPSLYRVMERRRWVLPIFALLVVVYALLAGWQLPAQRTALMTVLVAGLAWCRLYWSIEKVLLVAAGVLLLVDPLAVLSVAFWLSFVAVWLLLQIARRWQVVNPQRVVWWQRLRLRAKQFLILQIVLTLGLLPLVLFVFGQFSILAIPVNFVAIPLLSGVVLLLNIAGLGAWWISPHAADLFWQANLGVLDSFHHALQVILAARQDWVWHYRLSDAVSLASAALLLYACWHYRVLPILLSGFLLLPLCFGIKDPVPLRVHVFDVGQGLSVLLQTPQHQLLFDTASAHHAKQVVLPALASLGVRSLDKLILSQADRNHMGGMAAVLQQLPTANIQGNFMDFEQQIQPCASGQSWVWDGVEFSFLAPWPEVTEIMPREQSCVLRVTTAANERGQRHRLLILGAASQITQQMLQLLCDEFAADVVIVGGKRWQLRSDLLHMAQPSHVVWSASALSAHRGAGKNFIQQPHAFQIDSTFEHGTLRYDLGGDVLYRQAWRDQRRWLRP